MKKLLLSAAFVLSSMFIFAQEAPKTTETTPVATKTEQHRMGQQRMNGQAIQMGPQDFRRGPQGQVQGRTQGCVPQFGRGPQGRGPQFGRGPQGRGPQFGREPQGRGPRMEMKCNCKHCKHHKNMMKHRKMMKKGEKRFNHFVKKN